MLRTFSEPAAQIVLGDAPDIPQEILAKHGIGRFRLLAYVAWHAAHWQARTNQSRASRHRARTELKMDGRAIDRCHAAAIESGLIAEIGKPQSGKVTPLAYPWFEPPAQDAGEVVDYQPPQQPPQEPPQEPPQDAGDEQNRTEQGGGRRREIQPPLVASVATTNNIDKGCPKHLWDDPGDACGGCQKANERREAREARERAERQREAERRHHERLWAELDKAEAEAVPVEVGHVARLAERMKREVS